MVRRVTERVVAKFRLCSRDRASQVSRTSLGFSGNAPTAVPFAWSTRSFRSPGRTRAAARDVGRPSPHNNSLKPTAGIGRLLNTRVGRAPAAAYADRYMGSRSKSQDRTKSDIEVVAAMVSCMTETVVMERPALLASSSVAVQSPESWFFRQCPDGSALRPVDQFPLAVRDWRRESSDVGSPSPYNNSLKPTAGIRPLLNARVGRAPAAAYADR